MITRSNDRPMNHTSNIPMNQPIKQSIKQPISQSINRSVKAFIFVLLICTLITPIQSWPWGAEEILCDQPSIDQSMLPVHEIEGMTHQNHKNSHDPSLYELFISKPGRLPINQSNNPSNNNTQSIYQWTPGSPIEWTIRSINQSDLINGFFISAFLTDPTNNQTIQLSFDQSKTQSDRSLKRIGHWAIAPGQHQTIKGLELCSRTINQSIDQSRRTYNALSHGQAFAINRSNQSINQTINQVKLIFTPPNEALLGTITVKLTAVRSFSQFWLINQTLTENLDSVNTPPAIQESINQSNNQSNNRLSDHNIKLIDCSTNQFDQVDCLIEWHQFVYQDGVAVASWKIEVINQSIDPSNDQSNNQVYYVNAADVLYQSNSDQIINRYHLINQSINQLIKLRITAVSQSSLTSRSINSSVILTTPSISQSTNRILPLGSITIQSITIDRPVNQTTKQSINQFVIESGDKHGLSATIKFSLPQSIKQSNGQSVSQSIDQSINQSNDVFGLMLVELLVHYQYDGDGIINQKSIDVDSVNQAILKSIGQSINQSIKVHNLVPGKNYNFWLTAKYTQGQSVQSIDQSNDQTNITPDCLIDCSGHGNCQFSNQTSSLSNDQCLCDWGWAGSDCSMDQSVKQTINQNNQTVTSLIDCSFAGLLQDICLSWSAISPINQSDNQSTLIMRMRGKIGHGWFGLLVDQSINQSVEQSIGNRDGMMNGAGYLFYVKDSIKQIINPAITPEFDQSIDQSDEESIKQSVNQPDHQFINQTITTTHTSLIRGNPFLTYPSLVDFESIKQSNNHTIKVIGFIDGDYTDIQWHQSIDQFPWFVDESHLDIYSESVNRWIPLSWAYGPGHFMPHSMASRGRLLINLSINQSVKQYIDRSTSETNNQTIISIDQSLPMLDDINWSPVYSILFAIFGFVIFAGCVINRALKRTIKQKFKNVFHQRVFACPAVYKYCQPIDQSNNPTNNQSNLPSNSRLVNFHQSINQSIHQTINQTKNQPTHQSVKYWSIRVFDFLTFGIRPYLLTVTVLDLILLISYIFTCVGFTLIAWFAWHPIHHSDYSLDYQTSDQSINQTINQSSSMRSFHYIFGHFLVFHLAVILMPVSRNSLYLQALELSYEKSIVYHRFIGRMLGLWMIVHLIFVIQLWHDKVDFYEQAVNQSNNQYQLVDRGFDRIDHLHVWDYLTNTIPTRYGSGTVYGLISGFCFLILFLSSSNAFRKMNYELFKIFHFLTIPFLLYFANKHEAFVLNAIGPPLFFHVIEWMFRLYSIWKKRTAPISVTYVSCPKSSIPDVLIVRFEDIKGLEYEPGQYLQILVPSLSLFEWHPISISSSMPIVNETNKQSNNQPNNQSKTDDRHNADRPLTLHISSRGKGSFTHRLIERAAQVNRMDELPIFMFHGPYGKHSVDWTICNHVILIAGGIGITPVFSLLNHLLDEIDSEQSIDQSTDQSKKRHAQLLSVHVVWTAKSRFAFEQWHPRLLARAFDHPIVHVQLYETGNHVNSDTSWSLEQGVHHEQLHPVNGHAINESFDTQPVNSQSINQSIDQSNNQTIAETSHHVQQFDDQHPVLNEHSDAAQVIEIQTSSDFIRHPHGSNGMEIDPIITNIAQRVRAGRPNFPLLFQDLQEDIDQADEMYSLNQPIQVVSPKIPLLYQSLDQPINESLAQPLTQSERKFQGQVGLFVCGPQNLSLDARHFSKNRKWLIHEEHFTY